jgi:hypothetical protein
MNLFKAHRQWAVRPADERFPTLQALHAATKEYADQAGEKRVPWSSLRVEAQGEDVRLVGKANVPAALTHWSFGQLSSRVEAPAEYLRRLPPTLAAQNLNYGLAHKSDESESDAQLLFHKDGDLLLRAITSERYSRIWNHEVAQRLLNLEQYGWEPAVPDTQFAPSIGQIVAPAPNGNTALYASDHDMFAFLMNRSSDIAEAGTNEPLKRGFIVENSEVGASALKLTRFLYRMMCGNHIIWDSSKVVEISLRHIGKARERFTDEWLAELKRYSEESASDEEAKIAAAKTRVIGATKEEVLDRLFSNRSLQITRKALTAGYETAEVYRDTDGDPRTVWGMVNGLTRHSQTLPYADARTQVDRAAGRLLEITF